MMLDYVKKILLIRHESTLSNLVVIHNYFANFLNIIVTPSFRRKVVYFDHPPTNISLMKATFFLLLLLVVNFSFGSQKPEDRKIVLTARPQGGFYKIIVKAPANDGIQITYMLLDSVSKDLKNNTAFFSLLHKKTTYENMPIEARAALVQKMDSIMEQYRHYTTDSITLAAGSDEKYQQVVNRFFSSGPELRPANRIVLDGTSMVVTVSDGDATRTMYAQSPDQASYPLMYEFINETMNVYRQKKPEGILSKGRTGGY